MKGSRADNDIASLPADNPWFEKDGPEGSGPAHREDRTKKRGKGMVANYGKASEDRERDTRGTGLIENGGYWSSN